MIIKIPATVQDPTLTENQLILIAFLHRLRKMYKTEWYSIYRYDLGIMLQQYKSCHPLMMFEGLTPYVTVRYSSDYKMDVKLKRWTDKTYEYQLQDFRNVIVWSIIEDHQGFIEQREPSDSGKVIATPNRRHLISAINTHYLEYERNRLRK